MGLEHLPHSAKKPHAIYSLESRNNCSRVPFSKESESISLSSHKI